MVSLITSGVLNTTSNPALFITGEGGCVRRDMMIPCSLIDFNKESDAVSYFVEYTHDNKTPPHASIEVLINGACIRIYDGTDPALLSETIRILKEPLC